MTEERLPSKFAFILHADVAGSTELVQQNEHLTHQRIQDTFQRFNNTIHRYHGDVLEARGDALLAEFERASDAVTAALTFQAGQSEYLDQLNDDIRPLVRIGVAMGEVIVADNTVTGEGVVLAQRVEQLAEPGGMCITGAVHETLPKHMPFDQYDLGEQEVKGFDEPIRIYRVAPKQGAVLPEPTVELRTKRTRSPQWMMIAIVAVLICGGVLLAWMQPWKPDFEPASVEKMAFPLPSKPSIAVLPFDNYLDDDQLKFFADGLTENIISALSKVEGLLVIARNSAATFKDRPVNVKQVAEELGVQYVLEGSVQKSGKQLRITAQLVDALKGYHLWSERYDRQAEDVFTVMDEITKHVFTELQVELTEGEHARMAAGGTDNLEAWLRRIEGYNELIKFTRESQIRARELYQVAHEADPNWAFPVAGFSFTHWYEARRGWSDSREESIRLGVETAERAIELQPDEAIGYTALTNMMFMIGEIEKGVELGRKAIELAPNSFAIVANLAIRFSEADQEHEAVELFQRAVRLSPKYPWWIDFGYGFALHLVGRTEDAVDIYKKAIDKGAQSAPLRVRLAAAYVDLGRMEEAKAAIDDALEINPQFTATKYRKSYPYPGGERYDWYYDLVVRAGLPEHPPLKLPDKPSIAVLPFNNMSDDPKQEYFVDGMTEDLITDLSKLSGLFVIARNSSFTYKGKAVDVKNVARNLGVRYVMEGSVRRAGNQVRINAQLIDATTGGHLWAERYDGSLEDVFALQDQVTEKIVKALAVELTPEDVKSTQKVKMGNSEAYDEYLKGQEQYRRGTPKSYIAAIEHFGRAIELDPDYSRGYASLAAVYWNSARNGWSRELGLTYSDAASQSREYLAAAMKEPSPLAHQIASERAAFLRHRPDQALSEAQMAIALDSSDPAGHLAMAVALIKAKRPGEAVEATQRAMRLDPHYPASYLRRLGRAQLADRQFEAAATTLKSAIERNPLDEWAMVFLAAAYGHLGRGEKAVATAQTADVLRAELGKGALTWENVDAELYDSRYIETGSGGMEGDKGIIREGLRKAGVDRGFVWLPLVTTIEDDDDRCVGCTLGFHTVYEVDGATTIDAETAKSLHERDVPFIEIDPRKWFRTRIPGAHLMDWTFGELNERRLSQIVDRNGEVVISGQYYERNAANAAAAAVTWGFSKVYYFPEGFDGWKKAGYPIERGK